jgi:hypothetical protein
VSEHEELGDRFDREFDRLLPRELRRELREVSGGAAAELAAAIRRLFEEDPRGKSTAAVEKALRGRGAFPPEYYSAFVRAARRATRRAICGVFGCSPRAAERAEFGFLEDMAEAHERAGSLHDLRMAAAIRAEVAGGEGVG